MNNVISLAQKLIRFRTTPRNSKAFRECVRFLSAYTKQARIGMRVFWKNNIPTVFLFHTRTFPRRYDVLLQGHLDVVDGAPSQFIPRVSGGKLYGRGAIDMKTSVALMIELLCDPEVISCGKTLGCMVTFDEESGGMNGAGQWQGKLSGKTLINLDGGHDLKIVVAERGILKIRLEARGEKIAGAHAWQKKQNPDPFQKIMQDAELLRKKFPHHASQIATIWGFRNITSEPFPGEPFTYPKKVTATVVFYFLKEQRAKVLLEKIRTTIRHTSVVSELAIDPVVGDRANRDTQLFHRILSQQLGRKGGFAIDNGSSDARFFTDTFSSVIITRPKGGGAHAAEEWVSLKELPLLSTAVKHFLLSFPT